MHACAGVLRKTNARSQSTTTERSPRDGQVTRRIDLSQLSDATTGTAYWTAMSKDAWGNLTGETWAGGIAGTHTSTASTGQLKRQQWKAGATLLDQIDYAYDSFGNLTAQTATQSAASSESYTYDGLQRLTRAARSGVAGSPAAVTYGYTPSGNLDFKSDISLGSTGAYVYGLHGCGPHGVSEVKSSCGGGTGSRNVGGSDPSVPSGACLGGVTTTVYQCDVSGNVVDGAVVGRYDFENRPWYVERPPGFSGSVGTATYQYDASGDRFEEATNARTTWYGAAGFERSVDAQTTDRIELGPVTLTKVGSTTTVRPNLKDRLGSTVAIGNANGTLWQTRSYDAFGQPRNGDLSDRGPLDLTPATLRGFTGHEHVDDVRLIHMNGRMYDAALGRFLSVDPIIGNALNTQAINPYSYIGNNPLSGKDPTGYEACTTGTHITGSNGPDCASVGVSVTQVAGSSAMEMKARAAQSNGGPVAQGSNGASSGLGTQVRTVQQQQSPNLGNPAVQAAKVAGRGTDTQDGQGSPATDSSIADAGLQTLSTVSVIAKTLPNSMPRPIPWGEILSLGGRLTSFAKGISILGAITYVTPAGDACECACGSTVCGPNALPAAPPMPNSTPGFGDAEAIRGPTVMMNAQDLGNKVPVSGISGKEGAKDVPSWAKGERPKIGESGKDFADRLLGGKYGTENYPKGPGSEWSKIKKWGDRSFVDP